MVLFWILTSGSAIPGSVFPVRIFSVSVSESAFGLGICDPDRATLCSWELETGNSDEKGVWSQNLEWGIRVKLSGCALRAPRRARLLLATDS